MVKPKGGNSKADKTTATAAPLETPSNEGPAEMSILEAAQVLFHQLITGQRSASEIVNFSDFFEFSEDGLFMKVPARDEIIGQQPITTNRYITIGDRWGRDGTVTAPVCPIRGVAISDATLAAISYDPTTPWTGADWYKSLGGWLYKALFNNVRANKYMTSAQCIKIVKAILEYMEMGRATMLFYAAYFTNYENVMDYELSMILSSSGGSSMFAIKDALRSQLRKNFQELFFPYPVLAFWKDRGCHVYAKQYPWTKYQIMYPMMGDMHFQLSRYFDAWVGTNNCLHPETYLRNEGLWNIFRDNIVPILWGKLQFDQYMMYDIEDLLEQLGWRPVSFNQQYIDFIIYGFHLHPFDELLGVGQYKLPDDWSDTAITMSLWYWDSDGVGNTFILPSNSFLTRDKNISGDSIIKSPWLDPVHFLYNILANNNADDDAAVVNKAPTLGGLVADDGTVAELAWDEYVGIFLYNFFRTIQLESTNPDPDIDITGSFTQTTPGKTPFDYYLYTTNERSVPLNMPDKHWYHDTRKLYKFGCNLLKIRPNDVELYRVQRDRVESSAQGNVGVNDV